MSNTYYVVMRLNYEFNDEVNYRPDGGGGDPIKVFTDRKLAEFYVNKLDLKEYRWLLSDGDSFLGYSYDGLDGLNYGKAGSLEKTLTKLGFKFENYELIVPKKTLTDDEIQKIINVCNLEFHTIETLDDSLPKEIYEELE